jgi:P-type Ca2+ transporter type 2C
VNEWYRSTAAGVITQLNTDAALGLDEREADRRRQASGANELIERGLKSYWQIIREQLTASPILILQGAAIVSAILGDYQDTLAILAIVVLSAAIGFHQEYRTGKAIAALKQLAVPTVRVVRDGQIREISARVLVPGDIVLLEAGNAIPADGRLLESVNLRVAESALTGEATAIDKTARTLDEPDLTLGDRINMVYMGTTVIYGRGKVVITETGMATELGRIANLVQTVGQAATPLQRRLDRLSRKLIIVSAILVGVILVLGLLRGEDARLMLLTAVSMAVAVVPEGLPAIVTIALAIGAQRMLARHALIRNLPAVETLGSVTAICSDKTGTLTENCMTVTVVDVSGQTCDLTDLDCAGRRLRQRSQPGIDLLLTAGALCNDAIATVGDPTEVALVVAANRLGLHKCELETACPRIAEVPFDSDRKCMTTIHERSDSSVFPPAAYLSFTKGAVSSLLGSASRIWTGDGIAKLDPAERERIEATTDRLAGAGIRVLGVAFRQWDELPTAIASDSTERDLVWLGLVGMTDPPRVEVRDAVAVCRRAGIRPLLITGDHPAIGLHVAQELGMSDNNLCLTGAQLHRLSVAELSDRVESVSVYARVSPDQKLRIVEALQARGHIVAMTGDGVNDAPALRQADIGIAMGLMGTDVAKEAADMVLLDDNFATIVAAVREGRVIYDNIRKSIKYLLSGNCAEIWLMLLAPLVGMPLPLLPIQILWINLITDGLPALALSVEPAERSTMQRPPHQPTAGMFARGAGRDILWIGLMVGILCVAVGYWLWQIDRDPNWQTIVFTVLICAEMGIALALRADRDSLWQIGLGSNPQLLGAIALTLVLQLGVIYLPFLQTVFQTHSLSMRDLSLSVAIGSLPFWAIEFKKLIVRCHFGKSLL